MNSTVIISLLVFWILLKFEKIWLVKWEVFPVKQVLLHIQIYMLHSMELIQTIFNSFCNHIIFLVNIWSLQREGIFPLYMYSGICMYSLLSEFSDYVSNFSFMLHTITFLSYLHDHPILNGILYQIILFLFKSEAIVSITGWKMADCYFMVISIELIMSQHENFVS